MGKNAQVRSCRICFTINNYTEDERVVFFNKLQFHHLDGHVKYAIVGSEVGQNGTPHLQGFIHLDDKNIGLRQWREYFGELSRAHIENARGTDGDNREYCSKDGDFFELGTPLEKTSKWDTIIKAAKTSMQACLETDGELAVKHWSNLRGIHNYLKSQEVPKPIEIELRDWQRVVLGKLEAQGDRKILFVVDEEGGKGKTVLSTYIERNLGGYGCGGGKHADLAYVFAPWAEKCEYVAIDLTRTVDADYYPYHFMEDLKNGKMMSTKYTSKRVLFETKKVVVFTNQHPNMTKLSADRYEIYKI